MKKAQLEQPFVMIFTVVVIALVLSYGAYVIVKTLNVSRDIETKDFIEKLRKEINNCYILDKGSICALNKFIPPIDLREVCFINLDEDIDYSKIPKTLESTIENYARIGREENVFFYSSSNGKINAVKVANLRSSENPLCYRIVRNIELSIENKGSFVEIRR